MSRLRPLRDREAEVNSGMRSSQPSSLCADDAHQWRHEPRLSVGGRSLYICDRCGAQAVDDNEEPSSKGVPIKGGSA